MNFNVFLDQLNILQRSISINSPVVQTVRRTYWGVPSGDIIETPAIVNYLSEPERTVGMARRREGQYRIVVNLLAGKTTTDDIRTSLIATQFWFAAKNVFDSNPTINGSVTHAVLRGATPTVPVIIQHGGQAFIGFEGYLEITAMEVF